ncbi:hypothetical protein X741_33690 [Mesorhizobium sp. LNHC229A00]|nr:hypothetical protein X741_33690 [Mesorhizobium sp. LNHC229A00]
MRVNCSNGKVEHMGPDPKAFKVRMVEAVSHVTVEQFSGAVRHGVPSKLWLI